MSPAHHQEADPFARVVPPNRGHELLPPVSTDSAQVVHAGLRHRHDIRDLGVTQTSATHHQKALRDLLRGPSITRTGGEGR